MEQIKALYNNNRWVQLLALTGLILGGALLIPIAGGFPPWAWRYLFQVLPQVSQLWAVQGVGIIVPLLGLILLSLSLVIIWGSILVLSVKILRKWLRDYQSHQHFQEDLQAAEILAEQNLALATAGASGYSPRRVLSGRTTRPIEIDNDVVSQAPLARYNRPYQRLPINADAQSTNDQTRKNLSPSFAPVEPVASNYAASPAYPPPVPASDVAPGIRSGTSTKPATHFLQETDPITKVEPAAHFLQEPPRKRLRVVPPPDLEQEFELTLNTLFPEELEVPEKVQDKKPVIQSLENSNDFWLNSDYGGNTDRIAAIAKQSRDSTVQPTHPNWNDVDKTQPIPPRTGDLRGRNIDQLTTLPIRRRTTGLLHHNAVQTDDLPATASEAHEVPVRFVVSSALDPGIVRKYKPNEDSLFAIQGVRVTDQGSVPAGLFVVADGMGGHVNGLEASKLAIQTISDAIVPTLLREASGTKIVAEEHHFLEMLKDGVHRANLAIFQRNRDQVDIMGTTLTAALIVNTTAYIANIGDSRTYHYRALTGLRQVTRDHSPVANLIEKGLLKPEDIYAHPQRNQINRCLGDKASVRIDTFVEHLEPDDVLLLCSDGLWEMVRDHDIKRIIASSLHYPAQISTMLVQAALHRGGADNISVVVVRLTRGAE